MSSSKPFGDLTMVIVAAVVVSAGIFGWIRMSTPPSRGGLPPGSVAPPLRAQGWLNGEAPTPESLAGKVLVVDAWATWCGPCRDEAPQLVETYAQFRDRDVVFVGLTSEDASALPNIEAFLKETGISWLNGYGADETLTAFEVYGIPNVWVVGIDGKVTWNFNSRGSLEEAIEEALSHVEQ